MVDPKVIKAIQDWLNSDEKDFPAGAELLLRINRNRMMNQILMRTRNLGKLTYELRKLLNIMLDGMSRRDVVVLEHQVMPRIKESLQTPPVAPDMDAGEQESSPEGEEQTTFRGKRADHDELPESVRALYDRNGEVFFKMKETYNSLLQMEDAEPCDRYELLKMLDELDREYRGNWAIYDKAEPGTDQTHGDDAGNGNTPPPEVTPKQVNAARKYLSDNKKKLLALEDEAKRKALLDKMQQRVTLLVKAGETFDPEYMQELKGLGLQFS